MKNIKLGDTGSVVELLQLALMRAGMYTGSIMGLFDAETQSALLSFQRAYGLEETGTATDATWNALEPYLTGYTVHTIVNGDTYSKLAVRYGTSILAISTANPNYEPTKLPIGGKLNIPLGFDVVPTNISFSSFLMDYILDGLRTRYPSFIKSSVIGQSIMGRNIYSINIGSGEKSVFYNAGHHANEWITCTLLSKFLEDYAHALMLRENIAGMPAFDIYNESTITLVPLVNPDGVDLVTGALVSTPSYTYAKEISNNYPSIPFPDGWKANIEGVDLNLQYPAGWEEAREVKFAQGFVSPAPRDFVGTAPLSAPESRAVYDLTRISNFLLTLSYHTQGEVIYWKYKDYEPERSYEIAQEFSRLSGYAVEETPYASGNAGYKDWFVLEYNRPGYTFEVGLGINPLPISQFDRIYSDNKDVLAVAAVII